MVFNAPQPTLYTASDFTNYSVVFETGTWLDTEYAATIGSTTTITDVYEPSPVTVAPACATDNFADAIIQADLSADRIYAVDVGPNGSAVQQDDPYYEPLDCCLAAIAAGAHAWAWQAGNACFFIDGTAKPACTPGKTNSTAVYGFTSLSEVFNFVIGNGVCGQFQAAEFRDDS